LKSDYGLTVEQHQRLYDGQNGVCAICGQPETRVIGGKIAALTVDHNHHTGQVRGLLCSRCNLGLGMFCENIEFLKKAVAYLQDQAEPVEAA
jgi:hypothetical protein